MEANQLAFLTACLEATLDPVRKSRLTVAATQISDWDGIEHLAEDHSVAPIVYKQIRNSGLAVPKLQQVALAALALRHRSAHTVRSICVEEMLEAFDSQSIEVLALKGVALAYLAYPSPALRPMRDVDLLLNKRDLSAAREILCKLGYSFAESHRSRFMGQHHHLPEANKRVGGMNISVELHHDALAPDSLASITLGHLTENPQSITLDSGRTMQTFGHIDMLHHLCRHTFEPADEIRLIHAYDIIAYINRFANHIDWSTLTRQHPEVLNTITDIHYLLPFPDRVSTHIPPPTRRSVQGVGKGMKTLSNIFGNSRKPSKIYRDLFTPPAWWLYGYYGIHPDHSLAWTRGVKHPLTVARWLARRSTAVFTPPRLGL